MNFENKIMKLKDSLPLAPEGIENWILNKIKYPKAFTADGHLCYCGKCGNRFHTTREMETQIKSHIENPCQFCLRKSCKNSRLNEDAVSSRTDCYMYYRIKDVEKVTKCPVCGNKVMLVLTNKKQFFHRVETGVLTVIEGIQLLRYYVCDFTFVKGQPMEIEIRNICNYWISDKGIVRVTRTGNNLHYESNTLLLNSLFSLITPNYRQKNNSFEETPMATPNRSINIEHYTSKSLFPEITLAPYLKKRGFYQLSENQIREMISWPEGIFNRPGNLLMFLKCLIRFPFVETLVKKGDLKMLFALFRYNTKDAKKLISSYYIASRKGYEIINPTKWAEMIMLLDKAGKDIKNPKFICPEDLEVGLNEAIDLFIKFKDLEKKRKRKEYERTRPRDIYWFLEKNPSEIERCNEDSEYFHQLLENYGGFETFPGIRYQIQTDYDEDGYECVYIYGIQVNQLYNDPAIRGSVEESFKRMKGHLFNLNFGNEELRLESLDSIEAYYEESERMHNCLETAGYFLKPDSIILSVKKEGKSVADVELSLNNFEILQCLGPCNKQTPFYRKIKALITSNLPLIKSRLEMKVSA